VDVQEIWQIDRLSTIEELNKFWDWVGIGVEVGVRIRVIVRVRVRELTHLLLVGNDIIMA